MVASISKIDIKLEIYKKTKIIVEINLFNFIFVVHQWRNL